MRYRVTIFSQWRNKILLFFQTLANFVAEEDLESGSIYPPLKSIREVSMAIAIECAKMAYEEGKTLTKLLITLLNRFHSNWRYYITFRCSFSLIGV